MTGKSTVLADGQHYALIGISLLLITAAQWRCSVKFLIAEREDFVYNLNQVVRI